MKKIFLGCIIFFYFIIFNILTFANYPSNLNSRSSKVLIRNIGGKNKKKIDKIIEQWKRILILSIKIDKKINPKGQDKEFIRRRFSRLQKIMQIRNKMLKNS